MWRRSRRFGCKTAFPPHSLVDDHGVIAHINRAAMDRVTKRASIGAKLRSMPVFHPLRPRFYTIGEHDEFAGSICRICTRTAW